MNSMESRTVVVTGGSTGIGFATAELLAARGAHVVLFARSEVDLAQAREKLPPDRVTAVAGDVTQESDVARLFAQVVRERDTIDGLFVNAGIAEWVSLVDADLDHFDRLFAVNVRGAFLTIKHAERLLAPGASVLFNASVAVNIGAPLCSVYAATKGAVAAFAKSIAAELLPRSIRVNTLSPGPTATPIQTKAPMTPEAMALVAPYVMQRMRLGRLGTAEEIASVAAFLLSPASAFVVGQCIAVDGGLSGI